MWGPLGSHDSHEVMDSRNAKTGVIAKNFLGQNGWRDRLEVGGWRSGEVSTGLLPKVELKPRMESSQTTPTYPHRALGFYFTLFRDTLFLTFVSDGTSRAGSPGLCSVADTHEGLGRGPTPQGASGRIPGPRPLTVEPPPLTAYRAPAFCSLSLPAPSAINVLKQEREERNSFSFPLPNSELYLAHSPISQSLLWHVLLCTAVCTECGV